MGESLGGAVAVDLAARDGARALVLESTFSSLPDVAAYHYPLLPVRWLMRTRFDSLAKIGDYHGPLLAGPRRRRHDRAAASSAAACSRRPTSRSSFCFCPATTTTTRCRRTTMPRWRIFSSDCRIDRRPRRRSPRTSGDYQRPLLWATRKNHGPVSTAAGRMVQFLSVGQCADTQAAKMTRGGAAR